MFFSKNTLTVIFVFSLFFPTALYADREIAFAAITNYCDPEIGEVIGRVLVFNPSQVDQTVTISADLKYNYFFNLHLTSTKSVTDQVIAPGESFQFSVSNSDASPACPAQARLTGKIHVTGDEGYLLGSGVFLTTDNTKDRKEMKFGSVPFVINANRPF